MELSAAEGRCEEVPFSGRERRGAGKAIVFAHPENQAIAVSGDQS